MDVDALDVRALGGFLLQFAVSDAGTVGKEELAHAVGEVGGIPQGGEMREHGGARVTAGAEVDARLHQHRCRLPDGQDLAAALIASGTARPDAHRRACPG